MNQWHYYPFGMIMAGISGRSFHTSESKFKFNEGSEFQNKEFSDGNGLDWYGTDFRGYDPQLGQFRQIDPLAESTDSWGVYSFGFSNPITFNDPLGLTPIEGGCKPCIDGDTRSSGPEPEYKVLPVVEVVAKVKSKSTLANSAFGWANQIQGSGISAWRNDLYGYQRLRDQGLSSAQAGARHQVNAADFERRYQAEQSWRFANYVLLDVLTSFLPLPKLSTARLARSLVATKIVRNPVASSAAKGGVNAVEQVAVHGNSLKSLRPTWGYKLYSADGTFLKNGITSKLIPETRYTKAFMSDKYMVPFRQFPNRLEAYQWEFQQNQILRGPLNLNMH
jgi:RHS repeat-associated protein